MINKKLTWTSGLLLVIILIYGCTDLSVDNHLNPDTEEALANIEDIEALVGNQFRQWVQGAHSRGPNDRLVLLGMEMTNGFSFVSDFLKIPQQQFDNSPSYQWRAIITTPWSNLYTAISSSNDGLAATDIRGLSLGTESDTQRMRAFAKFIQGMSYGFLANHFDQAFLVDETVDLEEGLLDLQPYDEVLSFALEKLDEARSIAQAHSFTLPSEWIPGNALSSEEFIKLINSYEARYILQNARTIDERNTINWQRIRELVENGIEEDFIVQADGGVWSNATGILQGSVYRASYYLIARTDESGNFEDWRTSPPEDRREFRLQTADLRVAGPEDVECDLHRTDSDETCEAGTRAPGTDFRWEGSSPWPLANGGWYGSEYFYYRSNEAWENGGVGPVPYMRKAEMELYIAEALLRASEPVVDPDAVDLINNTRVGRGGLEPISVTDSFDDVWNAKRYEFDIETTATGVGMAYYHKRGLGHLRGKDWGGLIEGTPLHFPVPAEELDLLGLPYYTFGGVGGDWAAP